MTPISCAVGPRRPSRACKVNICANLKFSVSHSRYQIFTGSRYHKRDQREALLLQQQQCLLVPSKLDMLKLKPNIAHNQGLVAWITIFYSSHLRLNLLLYFILFKSSSTVSSRINFDLPLHLFPSLSHIIIS